MINTEKDSQKEINQVTQLNRFPVISTGSEYYSYNLTPLIKVLKYSEFGKKTGLPKKQTKYKDKVICFSTLNVCVLCIQVNRKIFKEYI